MNSTLLTIYEKLFSHYGDLGWWPAGFFNQKSLYLKAVTAWFADYSYDVSCVREEPLPKLRRELLAIRGIGPETADSILLYAFDFPTFVVDAYTHRLCKRYPPTRRRALRGCQALLRGGSATGCRVLQSLPCTHRHERKTALPQESALP